MYVQVVGDFTAFDADGDRYQFSPDLCGNEYACLGDAWFAFSQVDCSGYG